MPRRHRRICRKSQPITLDQAHRNTAEVRRVADSAVVRRQHKPVRALHVMSQRERLDQEPVDRLERNIIVKAANVQLIEIRLAMALGGKAFVTMTGNVAENPTSNTAGRSPRPNHRTNRGA